ncbi:hypothetical protein MIND_00371900 [Mycena indigotica]|uniref:NAD(P)-binding protein n=1 Tax=Mycena indigotica TaxID=2126181 RepID=A0A8H6WB94_9AGAR|nr:uncharacterized protein MIND_00371900 [Mycena indigotica]KAF7309991.1 hypothetical protein MIND_00371900 [Mycena indigotica]
MGLFDILRQLRFLLFTFLPDQFFASLPETIQDLTGRTYIVTGSNSGLGLATVAHLAHMKPARIILAVRDSSKGEKAREEVVAETGYTGRMDVWLLDMASFASVYAFAERANSELDRLDGAILNAGINVPWWRKTVDGWETILQVNTLATGFLGILLLPLLSKTASLPAPLPESTAIAPHLTITGSAAQFLATFNEKREKSGILHALNNEDKPGDPYPTSKLLLVLCARKLAALPIAKNVVVNVVDPGLCVTNIGSDYKLPNWVMTIIRAIAWTAEKGALNMTWAALRPTPPAAFVTSCEVRKSAAWSYTQDGARVQEQVWKEMVEVWSTAAPTIPQIINTL